MNTQNFFTRVLMYRDIISYFKTNNISMSGKWVSISGQANRVLDSFPEAKVELTDIWYPQYDWHQLSFLDDNFDFLFSDQVLEHVKYPWKAVKETHRILKKGGIHICTTCAFNPVHGNPQDYWRFMTDGLRVLHEDFEVLHTNSWGSADAVSYLAQRKPREMSPETAILAEKNEQDMPIHVWIIARK